MKKIKNNQDSRNINKTCATLNETNHSSSYSQVLLASRNKKAELTSSQIITLIILIAGFVIIIIAGFTIFDLYKQSDDEVCRLSIVEKATVPSQAQNYIPLKCTTKKICLSYDGKDCPEFLAEKNVRNIKLPSDKESAARMIEETMANAQYDCWSMTGRGQIDLTTGISTDVATIELDLAKKLVLADTAKPACLICSRIALASDVQSDSEMLKQVNVIRYMKETKVPTTDLTYLETFTDKQVSDYPTEFNNQLQTEGKPSKQIAYVFTQVLTNSKSPTNQAFSSGKNAGIATGTSLLLSPLGKFVGIKGTIIATIASAGIAGGLTWYQANQNQAFANSFCGKLTSPSTSSGKLGCTVITPANYDDTNTINQLCSGGILGSP